MTKYKDISTLSELEQARAELRKKMETKGEEVNDCLCSVKDAFTPINLLATGLKAFTTKVVPLDKLVLTGLRLIKKRLL